MGYFRRDKVYIETPAVKIYLRERRRLKLVDSIMHRNVLLDGQNVRQLVLPDSYPQIALKRVHDDAGHQGKETILWLAKQRFHWPGLEKVVNRNVEQCGGRKTPIRPTAGLVPIETTRPMQLVCIDFVSLERSNGGYDNTLVITDHFTRYAKAIPCKIQAANATAKALFEHFILFYSFPEQLHSDQAKNFESRVIREMCKLANVQKTRTTPYHPMGNGSAEQFLSS